MLSSYQAKADRLAEIKRLNGAIAALRSDLSKKEEALADCARWVLRAAVEARRGGGRVCTLAWQGPKVGREAGARCMWEAGRRGLGW